MFAIVKYANVWPNPVFFTVDSRVPPLPLTTGLYIKPPLLLDLHVVFPSAWVRCKAFLTAEGSLGGPT